MEHNATFIGFKPQISFPEGLKRTLAWAAVHCDPLGWGSRVESEQLPNGNRNNHDSRVAL
jgi:hypothetical protein